MEANLFDPRDQGAVWTWIKVPSTLLLHSSQKECRFSSCLTIHFIQFFNKYHIFYYDLFYHYRYFNNNLFIL
jgi:hypothetical protein